MKKLVKIFSTTSACIAAVLSSTVTAFAESGAAADMNAETGVVSNFIPLIVTAITAVGIAGFTCVLKMKKNDKPAKKKQLRSEKDKKDN